MSSENVNFNQYDPLDGVSPIDTIEPISTLGATGIYSEAQITTITSSIDPSITNLGYSRCHDSGHAGPAKLIPVIPLPGFGQNGMTQFPDAFVQRWSSYVDPATQRAPLVIRPRTRGRAGSGTVEYARDTQDILDILDHAIDTVGDYVYGNSAIVVGYSTGALDALNFAARCPDRCLGVVLYYPNYDLGVDPKDSYYVLQSPSIRASVSASVQPGGDVRLTPANLSDSANMDQYIARNPIDAIARIVALPNGPHIWIIGDYDETTTLPSISRLATALQAIPEAKNKTHLHITSIGDSNRVLHDDGVNGDSEIYAERYYFPYLLKNATEWTMPLKSPPGDFRVLGWMKTRLFELWLGPNTAPKTTSGAGGLDHAAELSYDDYSRKYLITTKTSTDGYAQIIRDSDNRNTAFNAYAHTLIDLNVSQKITSVASIGYEYSFRADAGVTDSSGVTNWLDQIGGVVAFTASTNKPATGTDGDGKALIRFNAASSQKLLLNSLLINPGADFTISCVLNKTDSSSGSPFELSHHGNLERVGLLYSSTDVGYARDSVNGWSIANTNGIGGHTWSLNAKHTISLMRKSDILYISIDGSAWSYSPYLTKTFTTTGTNTTSIGAGWANGAGGYWQFFTGDIYEIDFKQSATSEADIFSYNGLMRTRWTF